MSDAWNDAWHAVVVFVPKLLGFLLILVIGWFLAKLIAKVVDAILERVGFDRAVERGGIKKALSRSQYDASTIVSKLVFYTLLLFVLQLAFGVFGPNPISDLLTSVIAFLPRVLVAIVIIVVTAAIAAAVREVVSNTLGGLSYGRTLATVAAAFIVGIGVIAALNQVGIATTVTTPILIAVLTAIVGVIVVGVGGGLVKPMQARWESYLTKAEEEAPRIREEAANAPSLREQAYAAQEHPAQEHHAAPHTGGPEAGYAAGAGHQATQGYAPEAVSEQPPAQYAAPEPYAPQSYDSERRASDQSASQPRDADAHGNARPAAPADHEQHVGDTQVFEAPSVETQIFGEEPRERRDY